LYVLGCDLCCFCCQDLSLTLLISLTPYSITSLVILG
jgi:hypothetical protein